MGKRSSEHCQGSFDFSRPNGPEEAQRESGVSHNVVLENVFPFIDGRTQSARADAIRRVQSNGIFKSSKYR